MSDPETGGRVCGEPTLLGGYERPCQLAPGHALPHLRLPEPLSAMTGPQRLTGPQLSQVEEEYAPGLWRPSVPLPYYGILHVTCECRRRFWGSTAVVRIDTHSQAFRRYERHWRTEHAPAGRQVP